MDLRFPCAEIAGSSAAAGFGEQLLDEYLPGPRYPIGSKNHLPCARCEHSLLFELDRRLRTQFQILLSYLNLLLARNTSDRIVGAEFQSHVHAVLDLQEIIYRSWGTERIDLCALIQHIALHVETIYGKFIPGIRIISKLEKISLDRARTFHFALLVTEMLSFAYLGGLASSDGKILLTLRKQGGYGQLTVQLLPGTPSAEKAVLNEFCHEDERDLFIESLIEHLGGWYLLRDEPVHEEIVRLPIDAVLEEPMPGIS